MSETTRMTEPGKRLGSISPDKCFKEPFYIVFLVIPGALEFDVVFVRSVGVTRNARL